MDKIKDKYTKEFTDMFNHFSTLEKPTANDFMELFYTFENVRCLGVSPSLLESKMGEIIND